jgi:hypothetical protein
LLRALRKEPGERYPDAQSFAAALAPWLEADRAPARLTESRAKPGRQAEPGPMTGAALLRPRPRPLGCTIAWLLGVALLIPVMGLVALVPAAPGYNLWGHLIVLACPTSLSLLGALLLLSWVMGLRIPEGLWALARSGRTGPLKQAIANGVPLDAQDELGETALMMAAGNDRADAAKILLLNGADTRLRNRFGQTAVRIARASGFDDIAALIEHQEVVATRPSACPGRFRRPRILPWLFAAALLGFGTAVYLLWLTLPNSVEISYEDFLRLHAAGQVKDAATRSHGEVRWLEGEVKDPRQLPAPRLRPLTNRFVVIALPQKSQLPAGVGYVVGSASMPPVREVFPPSPWVVAAMLGLVVAAALLVGRVLGLLSSAALNGGTAVGARYRHKSHFRGEPREMDET